MEKSGFQICAYMSVQAEFLVRKRPWIRDMGCPISPEALSQCISIHLNWKTPAQSKTLQLFQGVGGPISLLVKQGTLFYKSATREWHP